MNCQWKSRENNSIKCERQADDSGYCIFHKKGKNNEENKIVKDIIIKDKISDFKGFIIEEEFIAVDILTYEYGYLDFSEVEFLKNVIFDKCDFKTRVCFNNTFFYQKVTFKDCTFHESCNFYSTRFNKEYVGKKVFIKAKFLGQNFIANKTKNLPRLDGLIFSPYSKVIMRDLDYKKIGYLSGKVNYRIARLQAKKIGDYESIGYYYYKERSYGTKIMKKSDYPTYSEYLSAKFFDVLSKYTIGYGERPWNILFITILIISIFAFLYMFTGVKAIDSIIVKLSLKDIASYSLKEVISLYMDFWYFSMVTFATVGYGDMVATTTIGKILVVIEVFFGVTVAATWASVVIKRMIR